MRFRDRIFLLVVFMILLPVAAIADEDSAMLPLQPGVALSGSFADGYEKRYRVFVPVAGHWRFSVDQFGVDAELSVMRENETVVTVDGLTDRYLSDAQVETVAHPSHFELTVRAIENSPSPGHFTILAQHLPDQTAADRRRIEAQTATASANRYVWENKAKSFEIADRYYDQALAIWRTLDDPAELADALYRAGTAKRKIGNNEAALAYLREAQWLYRGATQPMVASDVANVIGLIHLYRSAYPAAELAFNTALLALPDGTSDQYASATVKNNLCLLEHYRGNIYQAVDCYHQVLQTFERLHEMQRVAVLHNNLGRAYDIIGEPAQARIHLEKAVSLSKQVGHQSGTALSLNNFALLERRLGNFQAAIPLYMEALVIEEGVGDKHKRATTLHNIGNAYLYLGDPDAALGFLLQALELRRESGYTRGLGSTLTGLAHVYRALERHDDARSALEEALALRLASGDKMAQGLAFLALAAHSDGASDSFNSLDHYNRAIELFQTVGDQHMLASAWLGKGRYFARREMLDLARDSLDRSLAVSKNAKAPFSRAEALLELAHLDQLQVRFGSALALLDRSIDILESIRNRIGGATLRASFAGVQQQAYEMRVDVLMSLHGAGDNEGHDAAAMSANDWRMARSLAEVIEESRVDLGRDSSPQLSARRRELIQRISAKAGYLENPSKRASRVFTANKAERELDLALAELDSLETEIRRQDPRIEELERPAQITLAEIQQLLDKESVLLHYFLGETRSFLWLVTPESLQSFALPARGELEALTRTVYEELSHLTFGMSCPGQDALLALSGALLGDIKSQIANKRLVVVADGALAYLNFSALPDPNAKAPLPGDCHAPLLNNHEVVYLPSATILSVQRKTYAFRPTTRNAIAVFADPVYGVDDNRLVGVHTATTFQAATTAQPIHDFETSLPGRLTETSREASAIDAIETDWQTEIYLGFSANKKIFSAKAAGDYRVLHLATHGILDSQRPSMSSLLLSQYAADGSPQDGYLRLQDIYNLRLKSDLVVLSGCETALGRKLRGEGFIGLTRGFMYAGARAVISSLWRVEDTATAEFMKHFYLSLMQSGAAPAEALRYAQLKMARSQRWRQPYYWAAFVLQGDWQQ